MNTSPQHERLARLIGKHIAGSGCICHAGHAGECGCFEADWRTRAELAATVALHYCLTELQRNLGDLERVQAIMAETRHISDAGVRLKPWFTPRMNHEMLTEDE